MPAPLLQLQRHLLRHEGGDRVMAQVLAAVPLLLGEEPLADVHRYDALRKEISHVE